MPITDGIRFPSASEYEVSLPDIFCFNTSAPAGPQRARARDATAVNFKLKLYVRRFLAVPVVKIVHILRYRGIY